MPAHRPGSLVAGPTFTGVGRRPATRTGSTRLGLGQWAHGAETHIHLRDIARPRHLLAAVPPPRTSHVVRHQRRSERGRLGR